MKKVYLSGGPKDSKMVDVNDDSNMFVWEQEIITTMNTRCGEIDTNRENLLHIYEASEEIPQVFKYMGSKKL